MITARDRLTQAAAALLTAGCLVGIPAALLAVIGSPLPARPPTTSGVVDAVTGPLGSGAVVAVLAAAAWAAWVYLVVCLAAEVINATRRRGHPPLRVPLGAVGQGLVRPLVAALLLTGTAVPAAAPVAGAATPTPAPVAAAPTATVPVPAPTRPAAVAGPAGPATATHDPAHPVAAPATGQAPEPAEASETAADATLRRYVVAAPSGGYHDNLWDIAERHLGDGMRWSQIAALNAGRTQPDGDTFTDPDLIRPGWQLRMPADAAGLPPWTDSSGATGPGTGPGTPAAMADAHVVAPGDTLWDIAEQELGDGHRYPDLAAAAAGVLQPDGGRLTDPDLIRPGWVIPPPAGAPDPPAPAASAASTAPRPEQVPASPHTIDRAPAKPASPDRPGDARQAPAPTSSAALPTGAPAPSVQTPSQDREDRAAAWMLAGLTGAGAVLGTSMLLLLRQRRAGQARARRPGRGIAAPAPALAAVEKSVHVAASTSGSTVELLDAVLLRLAAGRARDRQPMPALAAVEVTGTALVLHLSEPCDLPPPWDGSPDRMHWSCGRDVDLDSVGPDIPDQPAPYPLLVTVGAGDRDEAWLLNCEQLGVITVTVAGDADRGRDFARYLAAEIACNPWSRNASIDCVGVAEEIAPMNPDRVRFRPGGEQVAAQALADAVATVDRAGEADGDIATLRAAQDGAEAWPGRLLLLDRGAEAAVQGPALTQLLTLVDDHPGHTGTSVVLLADDHDDTPGTVLHLTAEGRLSIPHAGLDLAAVGLSSDEASGCAALLAQAQDTGDVEIPADTDAAEGWRSWADDAGALRREHTVPRHTPAQEGDRPAGCLLDAADEHYVHEAATTAEDLAALSPQVPARVRSAVQQADPALDDDVAAWLSEDCDLPRLTLLGPVAARTRGTPVAKRRPYYTELLAFLATRPHGATPEEVVDAFNITPARVRNDIKVLRDWLGTNPRTGRRHLPDAREAPAARARGLAVYQVEDLLTDADLFRRLRLRGESRGADGIADLRQALTLVTGQPFDKLRPGGWSWLFDGDRLDQHMLCAVVDIAHIVTTHDLHAGDLPHARAAAELAVLAAPYEEIPRLDLAAVAAAQGHHQEAEQILRDQVCNRSDDGGAPTELPERTQRIIDGHGWLGRDKAAS